jgi:hypothetical protein
MKALPYLLPLLVGFLGCNRSAVMPGAKLDACALLTRDEIQAVQGSTITDTKTSEHLDAGLRMSQCYFSAEQSNKSVSLVVTQTDPDHPTKRTPKDYWKETFTSSVVEEKEHEGDTEEKEHESKKPVKIDGVGDDAYWSADRVGGALYAIKKDVFVRISLGGPDDQKTKIEKSKTLAQKALDRL